MKINKIEFIKMHGAGNDYIYIDCIKRNLDLDWVSLAKKLSDRHFGIGSDGLVLILPSDIADCRMRMFNADGSEAQICGNAMRCIAKYLFESGYSKRVKIDIETIPGIVKSSLHLVDSNVDSVSVELSEPKFDSPDLPDQARNEPMINSPIEIGNSTYNISCVSMGNPHAVIFVDDVADFPVEKIGYAIENNSIFPERTNVEFIEIVNREQIKLRVWERGSGETLACGSGACAAGVISIYLKKTDEKIKIEMPGGELVVEWSGGNVVLTGPAEEVFRGEIEI